MTVVSIAPQNPLISSKAYTDPAYLYLVGMQDRFVPQAISALLSVDSEAKVAAVGLHAGPPRFCFRVLSYHGRSIDVGNPFSAKPGILYSGAAGGFDRALLDFDLRLNDNPSLPRWCHFGPLSLLDIDVRPNYSQFRPTHVDGRRFAPVYSQWKCR